MDRRLALSFLPVALVCEIMPHFIPPLPNGRDGTQREREEGRGRLRDTPGRLAVVAEIETAEEEEGNFSDFPTVNVYYPPSSSLSRACPPVCLPSNEPVLCTIG